LSNAQFSEKLEGLLQALAGWTASLGTEAVEVIEQANPDNDEYGTALSLAFRPRTPGACPMEIGVTRPEAGSCVYIFLDRWSAIASRTHVAVAPHKAGLVGLYVEPIPLSAEETIEICRAVSDGAVHLEIGLRAGTLMSTSGYVALPRGHFPMHGVGVPLAFVRVLSSLGLGEVRAIQYAAWSK
jgi:hypothetical protein